MDQPRRRSWDPGDHPATNAAARPLIRGLTMPNVDHAQHRKAAKGRRPAITPEAALSPVPEQLRALHPNFYVPKPKPIPKPMLMPKLGVEPCLGPTWAARPRRGGMTDLSPNS